MTEQIMVLKLLTGEEVFGKGCVTTLDHFELKDVRVFYMQPQQNGQVKVDFLPLFVTAPNTNVVLINRNVVVAYVDEDAIDKDVLAHYLKSVSRIEIARTF